MSLFYYYLHRDTPSLLLIVTAHIAYIPPVRLHLSPASIIFFFMVLY